VVGGPRDGSPGTITTNDTDGDGLLDGEEQQPRFGTDPLDADTDDDGTEDGNQTYTLRVDDEETDAWLNITGAGNVSRGVNGHAPD
jgi:hypothetical protein